MHSALYLGQLRHRRFAPHEHEFSYPLFMFYVDLAELDSVFARRWLWSTKRPALGWFKRADYLGDANVPLDAAVRDRVEKETRVRPPGPIRMLTQLRILGFNFNPVTFYYCFSVDGLTVETIVAEISNTPWKERHAYVLPQAMNIARGQSRRYVFKKEFHVSPFLSMNFDYDWRFSTPGDRLAVHMENLRDGAKVFEATLGLERQPISSGALARILTMFPAMPARIVFRIYWQALKLWLKRVPTYTNPSTIIKTTDHERHSSRPSSI